MKIIDATHLGNRVQRNPSSVGKIVRRIALGLGYILALLLTLLFGLPVVLLQSATSVPAPLWISLMIADVALLILLFRLKPAWRGITISLLGVLVVSFLAILASQFFARTPPILDSRGNPLPGSIATLEKINLNGSEQWISIRGKDVNKPMLLFLAGGPGGSQMVTERRALARLEDYFVVVNWEQPGAGKSFDAVDRSTLTPERYIRDGLALVSYLRAFR